jgi:hypothetical protein
LFAYAQLTDEASDFKLFGTPFHQLREFYPSFWVAIFTIIITVFGAVFAFFQSMHLFLPAEKHETAEAPPYSSAKTYISTATLNSTPSSANPTHRGFIGLPPPTDPRTIQQREQIVKEVYAKLTQNDITAIALTGIGGVGKSTLAALIYRYVEEQQQTHPSPFLAEVLWLTIDPAITFADLAGNLFEALSKPLPDLSNLSPQNQAVALFHALNTTDKSYLLIIDQFENLLDWDTGHALANRPGVGDWLDIINSQPCICRMLLTSRPRPVGNREYPLTYLQEYPVGGLEVSEGVALLSNQGVQGTDEELQAAVLHCAGHAFSLTLLASLMRDHHMNLETLFKNETLWTGDIATNLLDQIYRFQLTEIQRQLLLAFSAYREPVPLDAALAIIANVSRGQASSALKTLLTQHLLEAVGDGCYQLHAIIATYAQDHFNEGSEQANRQAQQAAHASAAFYYLQLASTTCPPRIQRRKISEVHSLIEAVWQYCQAGYWQEAYDLMDQEGLFSDLRRWGGNAILLELNKLLLPVDKWHFKPSQAARIYEYLGRIYRTLGQLEQSHK